MCVCVCLLSLSGPDSVCEKTLQEAFGQPVMSQDYNSQQII